MLNVMGIGHRFGVLLDRESLSNEDKCARLTPSWGYNIDAQFSEKE